MAATDLVGVSGCVGERESVYESALAIIIEFG